MQSATEYIVDRITKHPFIQKSGWDPEMVRVLAIRLRSVKAKRRSKQQHA